MLGNLSSCSQQDPSFTEQEGGYYSVDIEGSDSVEAIQPPEVSPSELEDLISDYDATLEKSSNVAVPESSPCLSESFLAPNMKVKKITWR
jgi:hypothetical protein